jgi:arylsulfatase A-like enzyme
MAKQPNVLFLFSDQQRWDTVSCYGEPLGAHFRLTPNIDSLAEEGTRFNNAITCQPVCGPARACIQTGKYPTAIGCHTNDRMLPLTEKGIAHYFNEAGYETAYVGKWHLASNHSFANPPKPDTFNCKVTAIPPERRGGYKDYWMAADVLEFTSHGYDGYVFDGDMNKREFTGYRADAITDFALEYLAKPKDKPFFLFISYIEPHHQNDRKCFEGPIGSKERFRDFPVPGDLEGTGGDWREQMPDYLGCCKSLDDNVGRLIKALKDSGEYENTVIIYTSDHGSHFCTRNGEYKRSCHDNSVKVPFIARGPGFRRGCVVDNLTSLIDIAPTLLACAGIEKPDYMPGTPLQQLSMNPDVPIHDVVFIQISESCIGRALRTLEYTYCVEAPITKEDMEEYRKRTPRDDWEESPLSQPASDVYVERYLYDLKKDPYQKNNLVKDPQYAEIRSALREKLKQHILKEEGLMADIQED